MRTEVEVRIYPTSEQKQALSQVFGYARWCWNNFLSLNNAIDKTDVNAAITIRDAGLRILALEISATTNRGNISPKWRRKLSVEAVSYEVGSQCSTASQ